MQLPTPIHGHSKPPSCIITNLCAFSTNWEALMDSADMNIMLSKKEGTRIVLYTITHESSLTYQVEKCDFFSFREVVYFLSFQPLVLVDVILLLQFRFLVQFSFRFMPLQTLMVRCGRNISLTFFIESLLQWRVELLSGRLDTYHPLIFI